MGARALRLQPGSQRTKARQFGHGVGGISRKQAGPCSSG
ncbi:hypothetical protein X805_06450 [Sphaerotilus natans subsp. natans DSM 6575]|uniref:Uncharacterized protein n=1 Tax=Sphaerotilus natans subsp. natans DSM 6575 TaxID=1286631 RepID=A0A059KR85_9BURK|nr:hypothetical protein X805_06450 [Sphaerotilus natans subsp. natans DSM 6575]